jgi:hypothetical protein
LSISEVFVGDLLAVSGFRPSYGDIWQDDCWL